MTAGVHPRPVVGARRAACASTGNTSASLAIYCAATSLMRAVIFNRQRQDLLRQAVAGSRTRGADVQIAGDFDLRPAAGAGRVPAAPASTWSTASTRSGSKARRRSCSASSKRCGGGAGLGRGAGREPRQRVELRQGVAELKELGLIDRTPRLRWLKRAGADTFYQLFDRLGCVERGQFDRSRHDDYMRAMDAANRRADTLGECGSRSTAGETCPRRCGRWTGAAGWCGRRPTPRCSTPKAKVGAGGLGCEPGHAASVAGLRKLVAEGSSRGRRVVRADGPRVEGPGRDRWRTTAPTEDVRRELGQARRDGCRSPTAPCRCPTTSTRSSRRSELYA